MPPLTPQELEWILREIEIWLDDVWRHLSPAKQQQARAAFDRVRAAIAQARAAGPAGLAAAIAAVKEAMGALIRHLASIGVRMTIFFQRLVDILGRFVTLFGEGSAVAGGGSAGGGSAGAGTLAGGALVAEIIAVLFAVIAVIVAVIVIYREATVEIEDQPDGPPCGSGTKAGREMATVKRHITVWAFGRRSALKKALAAAAKSCRDDAGNCSGECKDKGKKCKPVMALQEYDLTWFFAATRAKVSFTCPCGCIGE
ncbi:MAG: hypothetical protein AAGA85_10765 [Bacteroidota bacterium]